MRLSDLEAAAARLISGGERREEPRCAVNIPAQAVITHPRGTSAMLRDVIVEELTPRGAAISCQWPIRKHWHVKLRFAMGATTVEVQGVAGRRRTRAENGEAVHIHRIEFIDPDLATLAALGVSSLTLEPPPGKAGTQEPEPKPKQAAAPATPASPVALPTILSSSGHIMTTPRASLPASSAASATQQLLTVFGGRARIEGRFTIEESIEIQCQVTGELEVGGTLVIGEDGEVSADVSTVHAVIRGHYEGNLKASGSVEIASTARVSGNIETDELTIARGAVFTGNISHVAVAPVPEVKTRSVASAPRATATVRETERKIPGSRIPVVEPLDIATQAQVELS